MSRFIVVKRIFHWGKPSGGLHRLGNKDAIRLNMYAPGLDQHCAHSLRTRHRMFGV